MLKILKFPTKGQLYDFDCGVAVAWSMIKYSKINISYKSALKASKVSPVDGLKPPLLIKFLKSFDLNAVCESNKNIRFLKKQINANKPLIVIIQYRKGYKKSWLNSWEQGHYVVVIGYDKNRIIISDPSMGGSVKILTHKEFYNRWHDYLENIDYVQTVIYIK